ncbi:MAG TPA: hypothetical protein VJH33_00675 [Candidatus Paceibacterota bacterium]
MLSHINKNFFIIGGIGVIVAGLVWYGMSSKEDPTLLTTTNVSGASSAAERELIDTLLALRAVSLDGAIFFDPAFLALRDFGTQIIPEPTGRRNPFAPLELKGSTLSQ